MADFRIQATVGQGGDNRANDCKLICALLNVYARKKGKDTVEIKKKADSDVITAIEGFQKDQLGMDKPDGRVDVGAGTWRELNRVLKSTRTTKSITPPENGVITWKAEGNEGGPFHSRILHVPSQWSGLTLGRGYDMKYREKAAIVSALTKVGVNGDKAKRISHGAGKSGGKARQVIIDQDLLDFEISPKGQLQLFEQVYGEYVERAKRLSLTNRYAKKYKKTEWGSLNPKIKNVLVDLTYRGDYRPDTMKFLQKHVSNNDFSKFKIELEKRGNWSNVPENRFQARVSYLNEGSG
ncbi:hypothetical protein ACMDCT_12305 [Halomonadaceae bacterium KBTZ08]